MKLTPSAERVKEYLNQSYDIIPLDYEDPDITTDQAYLMGIRRAIVALMIQLEEHRKGKK